MRIFKVTTVWVVLLGEPIWAQHDHLEAVAERPGHEPNGLIAQWQFWPDYGLPGVDYVPPIRPKAAAAAPKFSERLSSVRMWHGQVATDRRRNLVALEALPQGPFAVEFWISYHVNQPVGAAAMLFDANRNDAAIWQFGFWEGDAVFTVGNAQVRLPAMELKSDLVIQDVANKSYERGVTRYWHHLVAVYDGANLLLYHQGQLGAKAPAYGSPPIPASAEFEISAYLGHEPYMELGNLVKSAALYESALTAEVVQTRFEDHRELVEKGIHFRNLFHFTTAAPHLSMPTTDSIQISWETDRPAVGRVAYGETPQLEQSIDLAYTGSRSHSVRIGELKADTQYYYRVTAIDEDAASIDSGLLSFRTAVKQGTPVVFAAISDTEARPHVNARLAELIWRESPHLIINAGDLTDGGRHDHRAEWTHEYFAAMGSLMARTPFLPVMGNGEHDFVWFDRYHLTPGPEVSYYNFRFGDVEFFVLDSNLEVRDSSDPEFRLRQRSWLARVLRNSTARWKVATHHHPLLQDRYPSVVSDFVPLYEQFGVDLVLVGHHHNYLRSWPLKQDQPDLTEGITYVQLGGGGGNLSMRPRSPDIRWAKTYQGYGYSMVRILDDRLYYSMHDDNGAMRDVFTLSKRSQGPAQLVPGL